MTLVERYASEKNIWVCVMSVYNPGMKNYNLINSKFVKMLKKYGFKYEEMEGYWKGNPEPDSYFIISNIDYTEEFKAFSRRPSINQEAIIIKPIGTDVAEMVYANAKPDVLGVYQRIPKGRESEVEFMSKVKGQDWYWRYTTDVDAFKDSINEKMAVNKETAKEYAKAVRDAYHALPRIDPAAKPHWDALNSSNYTLFKRLLSRVDVVFTTESTPPNGGNIMIMGKKYKVIQSKDPYSSASDMSADVKNNNRIMISIDYSNHPVFSVEDNIVFRAVHDYIVHVLGGKSFGLYGELQAYNLHAKLVPPKAKPAIFTEVVGQVCCAVVDGDFPEQKVAVMDGFDYDNVGVFKKSGE